jgi:histidyl-tRNA synthetase
MSRKKTVDKIFCIGLYRTGDRERLFRRLSASLASVGGFYGFEYVHAPAFEDVRLAATLVKGGFLDRQALVCKTRSGFDAVLRPFGALGVLRVYALERMYEMPQPLKFMFEGDRFSHVTSSEDEIGGESELGMVIIGEGGPVAEAEIIQSLWKILGGAGIALDTFELRINATGCAGCHSSFRSQFNAYLRNKTVKLCKPCKRFLKNTPTKILLCKEEKCQMVVTRAPQMLDFLCESCKKHLRLLLEFLDEAHIPYFLDARLFKEDSPFRSFVFEVVERVKLRGEGDVETEPHEKNHDWERVVVAEGGRISRVAELVYGKPLEAVEGSILFPGVELVVSRGGARNKQVKKPKVFLAQLGELAKRKSLGILEVLRTGGIDAKESLGRDSIKSQLKVAERIGTKIALILGQKEALDGTIIVREVQSGIQETISQDSLVEFLKQKLKK